ncbi:MAG: hypothetical protein WBW69_13135 [Candidatus Korobacteraceae bacterium]
MSSPFFSELTKLDGSLRTMQAQVDRLRSGLDDNEDQLKQSVAEACQHASALRDLLRAEDAGAKWSDRAALEHLILALEIAADEKRIEQRRTKLLELASELEAGTIKHRVSARAESLNAVRVKAVAQLRDLAAQKEQEKELPGPEASQWLHWVCNLEEEKDAAVLAELRENFSALDELAASIEESFWVPGQRAAVTPPAVVVTPPKTESVAAPKAESVAPPKTELTAAPTAESSAAPTTEAPATLAADAPEAPVAKPVAPSGVRADRLPQEVKAHFDKAVHTRDFSEALSLCYDAPENETESAPQTVSQSEAKTPEPPPAVTASNEPRSATDPAAPPLKYCEECGRTYPHRYKVCPFDSTALKDLPESAPETPEVASLPDRYKIPEPVLTKASGADRTSDVAEAKISSLIPVVQSAEAAPVPPTESSPADGLPSSAPASFATFDEVGSRRGTMTTWLAVAALVVVCGVFLWMHFRGSNSAKAATSATNPAPATPDAQAASGQKPLLHIQPAEGAQDNILLSMENCERANPGGIECWGYISNQRNQDSKISLFRVNVIDGKGNSFDLSSKGQATFSDVHDFTVPAQSKVKYSVKVPDNDKDARTLTLYLDAATPRSSEYTFRGVPVSD